MALEVASTNETLRLATADVFNEWIDGASAYFSFAGGIPPAKSRELAFTMLSLLEGAFIFTRAMRSTEPLAAAGACATEAVRRALAELEDGNAHPDA